ncbi:hypothetical protein HZB97_01125 [Candidatus Gottesmanbacteria bacterium]|nr:hypothetical protein [Candidatus Gottesmanbacteria bacterium]MBI5465187.1 hypothetical protein [Candidatus Gottesmanbacteria bacterium]
MRRKIRKLIRKISKRFAFSKREKFALIIAILTIGLLAVQLATPSFRYPLTAGLVGLTYILSVWGLREDLRGVEWLTLFILPTMYAAAVPLFYFLLPVRWLTRLPTAILFALGMYAILLVENIYNVAAIRTIQLLRAAHSVGLLLTLLTTFLIFAIIFSLHLPFYWNLLLVFVVSFPLSLQSLWAMKLEAKINKEIFLYTLVISLVLAQLAFVFSFWPIQTIIEALFLTTVFYSLVGMVQQQLVERLFRQTMIEFIAVSAIVFILVLLTTRWGG